MDGIRKHIVSSGLLLIMLFSLGGISLHKMTCTMSGNSTISVLTKEHCCDKQAPNSISENCCDEHSAYVQVTDFDRTFKHTKAAQPAVFQTFAVVAEFARAKFHSFQKSNKAPPYRSVDRAILEVYQI